MDLCYYHTKECKTCKYVNYRDCPMFRRAHNNSLIRELVPFKYEKHEQVIRTRAPRVYYSADVNYAKSVCADLGVKLNQRIKKINMNQAIELALGEEQLETKILFIHIPTKPYGEIEKVKSVFISFLDKCMLQNMIVFVSTTVKVLVSQEWNKI